MLTGRLRWQAKYQAPVLTRSPGGQDVPSWPTSSDPFFAQVRSPNGREALNAAQQKATVDLVVTCHYYAVSPSPKGRLLISDDDFVTTRTLNIVSALDARGDKREWTLNTTELLP